MNTENRGTGSRAGKNDERGSGESGSGGLTQWECELCIDNTDQGPDFIFQLNK